MIEDSNCRNPRLENCRNPYQGTAKRVLCVCSAGLLRSPTAAVVLHREFGFNTRSAGLESEYALIVVDEALLEWADEIVCMTAEQADQLMVRTTKPVKCLKISDNFAYMDPELQATIERRYKEMG